MIAITPMPIVDTSTLVATTAEDEAAWAVGTTYAAGAVVSKDQRKYTSLQAANTGHDPATEVLWWSDDGASNVWAMFDTAVQTGTVVTGVGAVDLTVTVATGRAQGIGLMGLVGQTLTLTVRDGLAGAVIYSETRTLQSSAGTYFAFCFDDMEQIGDVSWTGLPGAIDGHVTIAIEGVNSVSCGLCMIGSTFDCGQATYGLSMGIEDRGRKYLDALGNPVTVERGYSRTMSGTLVSTRSAFNRLMGFYAANINNDLFFIAAPDLADLVAATTVGRLARVVPAITHYDQITTSIEIAGSR